MELWVTADLHLNHANIIKYCDRPFAHLKDMNDALIENWNSQVGVKDLVYVLGDFCFESGYKDAKYWGDILNGRKILIRGNHDRHIRESYTKTFKEIHQILGLNINKQLIVMCHYAMRSWPKSNRGACHLYGHSHGKLPPYGKSQDVGVDTNNFYPYNLNELIMEVSRFG